MNEVQGVVFGRVSAGSLPQGSGLEIHPSVWTFAEVERRLVEAVVLAWRDEPGRWPFAGDGPWSEVVAGAGDWDARGVDGDAPPLPRAPLSRAERAAMEEAVGWLAIVSGQRSNRAHARVAGDAAYSGEGATGCDARLVVLAVRELAKGRAAVPWSRLLRPMGWRRGAGGLRMRYERAVARIAAALGGGAVG